MRSPFPGMDPYLEAYWSNVLVLLMGAIASDLNRSLPSGLAARPEAEVRIETLAGERLLGYRPDVAMIESPRRGQTRVASSGVAVAEPHRLRYLEAVVSDRHVRIVDLANGARVVTAIEVLSPWNKLAGKLNRKYREKQRSYEHGGTNWVEIDLLRSSRRRLAVTWDDFEPELRQPYLALTYECDEGELLSYPIAIRSPLPAIRIPLRPGDPHAVLNLQAVVERAYGDGAFDSIDYTQPADPPLSPDDAAWLAGLLAARAEGAST